MKKAIVLTLTALLYTVSLMGQYSPCYEAAFEEGKRLYAQGKYKQAKTFFNEAKECPDPNTAAANEWIKKCDAAYEKAKNEQKKKDDQALSKAKEKEAAKTAYMKINRVEFGNVTRNGDWIDEVGSVLYSSELLYLKPRIYYDGLLNEDKSITLGVKIILPDGISVLDPDPSSGYTYSCSFTVFSGKDNIKTLTGYGNQNGTAYDSDSYSIELWYEGNMIYKAPFEVKPDGQRPRYEMVPDIDLVKSNAKNRYRIGNSYYKDEEYDKALEWYRKAAEYGLPEAQNRIGIIYSNGKGVEKDEIIATKWFRKAAEQGYVWGEYNLGGQYESGDGVNKDYAAALKWYRKAADQGLAEAQNRLGIFYDNGYGVDEDDVEAVKWYRKAAEQGYDWGQINLGHMYRYGRGVTKDLEKAKEWYGKAADQGNARGTELLNELEESAKPQ